jgi:hypothetical protein
VQGKLFLISEDNYTEKLSIPSAQRIEHLVRAKKSYGQERRKRTFQNQRRSKE